MPLSQRFFLKFFKILAWLDEVRTRIPVVLDVISSVTGILLVFLISRWMFRLHEIQNPTWWTWQLISFSYVITAIVSFGIGMPIRLFFRNGLPLLCYVPQSISMKEMGLADITSEPAGSFRLMRKYAALHGKKNPVRVICISGKYLFRQETAPDGEETPLRTFALAGRLEILMPRSSVENVTLVKRWDTYGSTFRASEGFSSIGKFVDEIDAGKDFLRENRRNVIHEHDMLCMWRVVLFDEHCIVQNYFPNHDGADSYKAPTFVFRKVHGSSSRASYYDTFAHMFDLVKGSCLPEKLGKVA